MDHPIPKFKEPIIYEGTDSRNNYTKWNVSCQMVGKDVKENLMKTYNSINLEQCRLSKIPN
jgi:hypothetical protein